MNKLLKRIYYRFVKDEKKRLFVRKIYCRIKIIMDMLKKDIFVPFVSIEHFYSPFPSITDINNSISPPPPR
jgi:hypothetical protein